MEERPVVAQAEEKKAYRIDFIDPLFAGSLAIGLTEGLVLEPWFRDGRWPHGIEAFHFWTFLLGFLTILLSWEGYHASIKTKPLSGFGRFLLDVFLVLLYAVLIVQYKNLGVVLFLLAVIYVLFFFWDIFKIREYRDIYRAKPAGLLSRYGREVVTVFWMFVFALLSAFHHFAVFEDSTLLVLAYSFTVLYRIDKKYVLISVAKKEIGPWWFGS